MTVRKDHSFSIRMSGELRDALGRRAEREGRSVANLINFILQAEVGSGDTGLPPEDGQWIVHLQDDGSGAELWAFYEDVAGRTGWHNAEGEYDDDRKFPQGAIWFKAPKGYVAWINRSAPSTP